MDRLLEVQQQLTRLAAGLAEHSQLANSSLPPAAAMTPTLIHIEQLLDEIRASTRAVVAKASKSRQPEPRPAKRLKTADFRVNLESEDVVDYESETETEDEAVVDQVVDADELKQGKSGCNVDETEEFTGSNTKEDRSEQNDDQAHQKVQQQRLDPAAAEELEKQLKKCVKSYISITKKAAELNDKTDVTRVGQVMATIGRWSIASMAKLLKLIRGGGIPSVEVATAFCEATVLLPSIIEPHCSQRSMSQKWFSTTIKRIQQIAALAKSNAGLPNCLSASKLDATRELLQDRWANNEPDFLHQMETYIARIKSQPGALEPDRIDKPMGKLASLFHHDFKLCTRLHKPGNTPQRTEEGWKRFAHVGEVLAEWILLSERASSGPKLPVHLASFERQLRGFAKKNPERVPASLLEYVLVKSNRMGGHLKPMHYVWWNIQGIHGFEEFDPIQ